MKVDIKDNEALCAVSPSALAAYARAAGWSKSDSFGDNSDVYAGNQIPEIILPRTSVIADYARVVGRLIEIFSNVAQIDELALYRDLVTADRDVIRIRTEESDGGAVPVNHGIAMMEGTRDMLLATVCSLNDPRPLYRTGSNKEATEFVENMRWGQTEQGSFVATLLTPKISPPMQPPLIDGDGFVDDPIERKVTKRLVEALSVTSQATEMTVLGESDAFIAAVPNGASANLCEALAKLINPFPIIEVKLSWALTRKMDQPSWSIRFPNDNVSILSHAAKVFREREPRQDVTLSGFVGRLKRDESESDGTITLQTSIDRATRSVSAVLNQFDYEQAVRAHEKKAIVTVIGDLERHGQRWHLLNPTLSTVVEYEGDDED